MSFEGFFSGALTPDLFWVSYFCILCRSHCCPLVEFLDAPDFSIGELVDELCDQTSPYKFEDASHQEPNKSTRVSRSALL